MHSLEALPQDLAEPLLCNIMRCQDAFLNSPVGARMACPYFPRSGTVYGAFFTKKILGSALYCNKAAIRFFAKSSKLPFDW